MSVKIYGTIGPACADEGTLKAMVGAGMCGLRLNLSHGTLGSFGEWVSLIAKVRAETLAERRSLGLGPQGVQPSGLELIIDLIGPETRIGVLQEPLTLRAGEEVWVGTGAAEQGRDAGDTQSSGTGQAARQDARPGHGAQDSPVSATGQVTPRNSKPCDGSGETVPPCTIPLVPLDSSLVTRLAPGMGLLLSDGAICLNVLSVAEGCARCAVVSGGVLESRKSITFPEAEDGRGGVPTLTDIDIQNLRIAKCAGVTGVMLPFVRGTEDIRALREAMAQAGLPDGRIFAKVENRAGVSKLMDYAPMADEIVIARGDLGANLPPYSLPGVQRDMAQRLRAIGKPFMIATQLLHSMTHSPTPTRAEVSDIALAVWQGASSLILTGETAVGDYPVEAIQVLRDAAEVAGSD